MEGAGEMLDGKARTALVNPLVLVPSTPILKPSQTPVLANIMSLLTSTDSWKHIVYTHIPQT